DCLSQKIGLFDTQKMEPCGRIGFVNEEMSYDDFRRHVKNALGINSTSGVYCGKPVNKVAVVSGSGKEYITDAKKAGADTFLTGEMNHSSLIEAREIGLNVVCGTHYATENVVLQRLKVLLLEEFPDLEIEIMPFEAEREYGI
ncbi:MAG TPA: hypothetical protein DD733_11115, partial [Clostridiales bacterium]|nr:hypothetical protein [Clostridiales bacterium]